MLLASPASAPRIGVPLPANPHTQRWELASRSMGIDPYPWQRYAAEILEAEDAEGWLYREVAIITARQNGKTSILKPRILEGLARGETLIHTAQNRLLPRRVFIEVARHVPDARSVRYANGQEEIITASGGRYIIVAPQRGARGESADVLIIDELREMEDFDFIAAADPTIANSSNPQVIYLSNAGTDESVVLNDLRARRDTDPSLAYLEWSAAPEREVDDRDGWLEANPSIGYSNLSLEYLETVYERYRLAGELSKFETEHLCRWVKSMLPRLVSEGVWLRARAQLSEPSRPALGISVHPSGRRASAVIAWLQDDGSIGMRVEADVSGDPINVTAFAADLVTRVNPLGISAVGFDTATDQHLARHFIDAQAIIGKTFSNASERFVRDLETGALRWQHADAISEQLPHTARKDDAGSAWYAQGTDSARPVTAVLAAIRAVWLASNPQVLTPRVF